MTTPTTLRMKVDSITEDLAQDTQLFSGVLDGLIKKAKDETVPAEVQSMADSIVQHTGCTKEAALKMAWGTYVQYVNPEWEKQGKKKLPPAFLKNIEKAKEKGGKKKEEKKPPFLKKKAEEIRTAEALELAEKLGVGTCPRGGPKRAQIRKQTKAGPKTEEAKELEGRLER